MIARAAPALLLLASPAPAQHAGHAMPQPPARHDAVDHAATAPAAPAEHAADAIWDPAAMARARATMMREEGGGARFAQAMVNLAERRAHGGYRWDAEGWYGSDLNRLVVKSEGEGGHRLDEAEVQLLYSRAIGPYFNLQAGVRHDIRPHPQRSYATIAVDGLAPYWFDVEAALFLSDKGDVLGRIEASYDQRITQRLILQPRAELNLAAQRVAAQRLGSGITDAEIGLRLRYEVKRELAPYIGLSWERMLGGTADITRAAGRDRGGPGVVLGVRGWF